MNIGASGAAASMGVAYGAGAINNIRTALWICAAGVLSGAVLGGGEVVKTISSGIIPQNLLSIKIVLIILLSATISLFLANVIGIPLSTSEVTVGAVVGVGVAYQVLYVKSLITIMSFWVIVPVVAFVVTWLFGLCLVGLEKRGYHLEKRWLAYLLIISGFFEAFSAGMNNVANAVGPLVGAGLLSPSRGILIGGLFVALGAVLLGKKVVETNGKKITQYSKAEGIVISSTGAILVMVSSLYGLPIPLTQVTSSSIIGLGVAKSGKQMLQKKIVKKIVKIWVVSPLISLSISYFLVKLVIDSDLYSIVVPISVIIATVGALSLMRVINEERRSVHEDGGGI
ncbi:inorganic phosphate transporter family protein [Rossellomorea aquimaris]|uniref:inorganic phosphate transporter n=1 Tax=Rossellomorea TaxID=2837508 RepID=UPI001CD71781|nr:inorganic phosphate transporter [Rossellomorea aquimaris]MCA1058696.1 inorganic phosphate transporter family protein [Rossellomorea aquimaris]